MVGRERHQPLHDPEASAPGGERAGVILLRAATKPTRMQRKRDIMLPAGIAGVGVGEAFSMASEAW